MKIAICISGQVRTFDKSFISLKKNYLDKYDCDIYCHTWSHQNVDQALSLFKPKSYMVQDPIIFDKFNVMCPLWNGVSFNNLLSQYHSLQQSFLLCKKETNVKYDLLIRSRYDINYDNVSLDLLNIDKDVITLPEWYTDLRCAFRGYCDLFAVGNLANMTVYSDLFSCFLYYVLFDRDFRDYLSVGWLPDPNRLAGQDSPMRPEYLVKWNLIKHKIPVKTFETPHKRTNLIMIR